MRSRHNSFKIACREYLCMEMVEPNQLAAKYVVSQQNYPASYAKGIGEVRQILGVGNVDTGCCIEHEVHMSCILHLAAGLLGVAFKRYGSMDKLRQDAMQHLFEVHILSPELYCHQPCIDSRSRVGLDYRKRSKEFSTVLPFGSDSDRSGLCSKLPDMRSVGHIALNP